VTGSTTTIAAVVLARTARARHDDDVPRDPELARPAARVVARSRAATARVVASRRDRDRARAIARRRRRRR
jgi:hypothetical protein